ncbi:MAG: cyclic nucleotide-binding domain-containing protein, partial [Candidatus Tectomicrobia bacterium]|nr:cyclic nucleotide-binding domain-containing protein [Candidatus Tectomicrobia bacterium]
FVIISGKVRVVKGIGGRERVIRTLGPHEYFGEMALLDEFRRSASVIAEEDTECLLLVRWDFRAELRLHPEIALHILPLLSRRLREAEERTGL